MKQRKVLHGMKYENHHRSIKNLLEQEHRNIKQKGRKRRTTNIYSNVDDFIKKETYAMIRTTMTRTSLLSMTIFLLLALTSTHGIDIWNSRSIGFRNANTIIMQSFPRRTTTSKIKQHVQLTFLSSSGANSAFQSLHNQKRRQRQQNNRPFSWTVQNDSLTAVPTAHNKRSSQLFFSASNNDDEDHHLSPQSTMETTILKDLNASQKKAVTQPLYSITRVVAGPGAGKTRVLTCRIAYLLQESQSQRGDKILAVTFTKKAAMEMQHRLQSLLQDCHQNDLQGNDGAEEQELEIYNRNSSSGDDGEIYQEEVPSPQHQQQQSSSSLAPLMDRVTLGTFHSICAKILRWNGRELATLPFISKFAASVSNVIPTKAATNDKDDDQDDNNNDKVAPTPNSRTLDGTFAIVDQSEQMRIIKQCLTDCGISLKAGEGGGGDQRKNPTDIKPITILNAVGTIKMEDALMLTKTTMPNKNKNKNKDDSYSSRKMSSRIERIATEIYPHYQRTLISQNSLDFDDLILLTRELLLINPNHVRDKLQARWRHVLVDEFQDTSRVQLDLIKLLSTDSLLVVGDGDQSIYSWRGAHVGSMEDFVEEFHGGSGNFSNNKENDDSDVRTKSQGKEVETVYLMENYRSTSNIVKAAQKIISNPSSPFEDRSSTKEKYAITQRRKDMKAMRGSGPSPRILACADAKAEATFVVKTILKMAEEDLNPSSSVAIIYRTNAQSRALEEACVEQNLKYLVRGSAGTFYSRAEIKDCLCFLRWLHNGRDRNALIRAIKTPSRGIGDVSLNEFFSYCEDLEQRFIEKYPDSVDRPTPLDTLIALEEYRNIEINSHNIGNKDPLLMVMSLLPPHSTISKRTFNRLVPFASQMKTIHRKAQVQTVSALLNTIIQTLDLRTHFDSISKTSDEFADRWGNVMELCNAAERYNADGPSLLSKMIENDGADTDDDPVTNGDMQEIQFGAECPLGNFLDDVSLLTDIQGQESGDDLNSEKQRLVANLMTIHASKGMEFDAVFLVGNEEGTFPTQRSIIEGEGSVELDEERRLCYVAMTRAKTHLVMTWRREVMTFFGQGFKVNVSDRSRFLEKLVSKKTKKSRETKKLTQTSSETRIPSKTAFNNKIQRGEQKWNEITRNPATGSWDWKPATQNQRKSTSRPGMKSGTILRSGSSTKKISSHQMGARKPTRQTPSSRGKRESSNMKNSSSSWEDWKPAMDRGQPVAKPVGIRPVIKGINGIRNKNGNPKLTDSLRGHKISSTDGMKRRQQNARSESNGSLVDNKSDSSPAMDSTLFFPVGSSVFHTVHGNGKVVSPSSDSTLVSIQFENGIEVDFPVGDTGLRRQY